ncbi:UDP-N-acetylglucosamine--peptide N-acetylglucosaminyltransferase [Sesbania bispinosa]|nr:UDP-N-acetylglucosamine--peptide N-acetylglucosaminyltransferase [Sesbania bispinosa]
MVCQLECTSSDLSECNFSEGEDDDIGAHLFKDMMQNYVEGNSNANLKCEFPRSVADVGPIVCTAGPNAKPSSEVANAARLLLCEETSNPSPIVVAVRPFEDAAGPGPIEGPVSPSISSPLDVMLQVGNKQMQGTNSSSLQGRDHSLTPPHYSEELVEVSKQLKTVGVGDAVLGTNAENLTVQIEDPQLCEVPIVLEGEIEGSGKPTQLEVVGGQKRGRGRPRKRAHVKAKVSNLPLNALPDAVVLEENPQLVANKVWHICEKLGVTLEGETVEIVQKLTEMEERDRKVVGRIRSVGGT